MEYPKEVGNILYALLLFLFLSSCTSQPIAPVTSPVVPTPVQTATARITETLPIVPSATSLPIGTMAPGTPILAPTVTQTILPTPTKQIPQSGAIVFAGSSTSWKQGIFIINFPEMNLIELTGEHGAGSINFHPSWSPDGKWIVYSSDTMHKIGFLDLYLVQSDGQTWHRLTLGEKSRDPDWSPNGQWIAYVINNEIGLISPDGAKSQILTYQPGLKALPTWSPDGRFLAYLYYNPEKMKSRDFEIWVLEVQSRQSYRVATGAMREPRTLSWSLDGNRIIFGAYLERDCKKLYSVENKEDGRVEEIVMSPTGRQEGMVWSPDGEWVAYAVSPAGNCKQNALDAEGRETRLFIARPDGSNVIELANLPEMAPIQPKWKP